MRTTIAILMTLTLTCTSCALLDSFLGERETQAIADDGSLLFETPEGALTTDATGPGGLPNKPRMVRLVSVGGAQAVQDFAAQFGPWGALIGAVATGAAGLYARLRNKQRLTEQGLRKQAQGQLDETASALAFTVRLIEKIKTAGPDIDRNNDGKVSFEEIKQFVRDRGARFKDPAFLAEVVRIANASLTPAQEAEELRQALAG